MSATVSRIFNQRQLRILLRIGELMVPGIGALPSFKESGCMFNIDSVMAPAPTEDTQALKLVLTLLSYLPFPVVRGILNALNRLDSVCSKNQQPRWLATLTCQLRLLLFGLRGIIFTLYYSGQGSPYQSSGVYQAMGYKVQCEALSSEPRSSKPCSSKAQERTLE